MDVDLYLEVRRLFQTKWDPAVLDVLAERPSRFLALVRRLRRQVDDQLADGNVTRSLNRLGRRGLVRADFVAQGTRRLAVYSLTDQGRQVLDTYRAILTVYADGRGTAPDGASGEDGARTAVRSAALPTRGTNDSRSRAGEVR